MQVYGIRHHGPGSARSLRAALERQSPDCILIEAPQDAEPVLASIGPDLIPPVAILLYPPDKLQQAVYYPFASFSPEWQALQYAFEHDVPVRFMDLPLSYSLAIAEQEQQQPTLALEQPAKESDPRQHDPIGQLARLAGYSDSERWWDLTFEHADHPVEIFDTILDMVTALRDDPGRQETSETLLREAYMRHSIRQARKDGCRELAVVCGAWHAPVLQNLDSYKATADRKMWRGMRKKKTAATWIPWSYSRLARYSGYAAGVISPAWYRLLFDEPDDPVSRWMVRAVQLLRKEGFQLASGHALEATRLATALALLRQRRLPGLEELEEAALTILAEGSSERMALISAKLITGSKVGLVPDSIPVPPLQRDLEKKLRSARLSSYWGKEGVHWLKATKNDPYGHLDLRKEIDLDKSRLLHRLRLLDIPWGTMRETSEYTRSSFKEVWKLQWFPDFVIQLIEHSALGNTIEAAATRKAIRDAEVADNLLLLTRQVMKVLRADLPAAVGPVMTTFQRMVALAQDVQVLLSGLPPLVTIIRYGDTRQTDVGAVEQVLNDIVPRICHGLAGAGKGIDESVARPFFQDMIRGSHALDRLNREDFLADWYGALDRLADQEAVHALLRGAAARLLFDKGHATAERTGRRVSLALSPSQVALDAAHWLEGFLYGSGLILVHHLPLWNLIDEWVQRLPADDFRMVLPLLRRSFSAFSSAERSHMLELVKEVEQNTVREDEEVSVLTARTEGPVLKTVRMLLGLE